MDRASRTQVNIFKLFWPSYKFLQAHSFTNCLLQTCLMRALVSKKGGYYPLGMFRYKAARTFDLSLMKGAVFKSYSCLFHSLIAKLLLSCSNLEVVKGSFLWSFSVQSAKQWGLIKWTLMCSLSTRMIVDLAFTSKGSVNWRAIKFAQTVPIELFIPFSFLRQYSLGSMTGPWFNNIFRAIAIGNVPRAKK